ncbi:hypothetical protein BH10PSE2_BH10PSE2_25960 [soil metagenome]
MRRRDLIAAGTALAIAVPAGKALAGEPETGAAVEGPAMNIAGVGLPVIVDGRIKNYVFVTVKLHLGGEATAQNQKPKDPFYRDALVRAGHLAPFTVPDDWTRLSEEKINAAVMAIANVVSGRGSVIRSEVLIQTPRRRTGMQSTG